MPVEVILRRHVDNLGRSGEIVKVADGYARNYLLPLKIALPVTEAICADIVSIPVHPHLTDAEVGRVISAVCSYES